MERAIPEAEAIAAAKVIFMKPAVMAVTGRSQPCLAQSLVCMTRPIKVKENPVARTVATSSYQADRVIFKVE